MKLKKKNKNKKSKASLPTKTHVYFILDRSGSMGMIRDDVIGGFNTYIAEQKDAGNDDMLLTLVQFDSQDSFEVLEEATPIAKVRDLDSSVYVPRAGTPLLDAEGQAIAMAKTRALALESDKKEPEAIVFVSYTDGMENTSHEYKLADVKKAKDELGKDGIAGSGPWNFVYLGANQDAYAGASSVGTSQVSNTTAWVASSKGVQDSFKTLSSANINYRSARNAGAEVVSNAYLTVDDTSDTDNS